MGLKLHRNMIFCVNFMLKHNCDVVEIRVPIARRMIKLWAIVSYFCLVPRLSHGTIPQRSEGKLTSDDPCGGNKKLSLVPLNRVMHPGHLEKSSRFDNL